MEPAIDFEGEYHELNRIYIKHEKPNDESMLYRCRFGDIYPAKKTALQINANVRKYLNANYINLDEEQTNEDNYYYIASDNLNNLFDIYNLNVTNIVSLINNDPLYLNEAMYIYGSNNISTKFKFVNEILIHREIILNKKTFQHFKFLCWEDHDIPDLNKLLYFMNYVKFVINDEKLLVHCLAGVGRTGTFIILYELLIRKKIYSITRKENIKNEVNNLILKLRSQRHNYMVQNYIQYKFIFDVIAYKLKDEKIINRLFQYFRRIDFSKRYKISKKEVNFNPLNNALLKSRFIKLVNQNLHYNVSINIFEDINRIKTILEDLKKIDNIKENKLFIIIYESVNKLYDF